MIVNQRPGKNKCSHGSVQPKKVSEDTTELYCVSCGEVIGYWIVQDVFEDTKYIAGKVRELDPYEREELK